MRISKLFLTVVLLSIGAKTFAQNSFTGYLMPSATVKYALNSKISQSFAIENRNFAYAHNEFDLRFKHFEFAHFSKYKFKEQHQIGLGISYRFESDKEKENELRLMQQYEWKAEKQSLVKHRIRTEQRIYDSLTKYRLRYQTGLSFPTKKICDEFNIGNEIMMEISKARKPDYEERIITSAGWDLSESSLIEIGAQYRLSDFTNNLSHNVFLTAALTIKI